MIPVTDMIEADGYVRYSSDGQAGGSSEPRQTAGCQKMAAELGARLTIHFDRGVSARDGANLGPGTYLGEYEIAAMRGEKRGRLFITEYRIASPAARPPGPWCLRRSSSTAA